MSMEKKKIMSKELEKENRKRIGKELRAIRELQGWSTDQVGMMAGVKGVTVEKVEAGVFDVKMDIITNIASCLGYVIALKPMSEE